MVDRTVSDVFLTLWRFHVTHAEATDSSDFVLCAECWEKIRKMEENAGKDGGPSRAPAPTCPPEGEKSTPDEGEKVHEDASKKYAGTPAEDEADDTSSAGQSPAPSPCGEGKRSPWETYRSNCQTRLLASRFSTAEIAKASDGGCTLDNVQAFLMDSHAVGTVTIGAIMKAMDKLEGKA